METQTWTVYRNPGLILTHFQSEGDEDRTICKHYRIAKMQKIEHDVSKAALWCTDCFGAIRRNAQEVSDGTED